MKCSICKNGDLKPGFTTVALTRGKSTLVVKEVPAEVCTDCAEYWLDEKTTNIISQIAEKAAQKGTEVEVCKFVAA